MTAKPLPAAGDRPIPPGNRREQLKAQRRARLLTAGAGLIAERGFAGMRLEDLGAAAGISGPAVYRHFPNKEALLVELLGDISERLLAHGQEVIATATAPAQALAALVDSQLEFALSRPDLIRMHDRDLHNLPIAQQRQIRTAQRRYVEVWVTVLRTVAPRLTEAQARVRAHAVFGLLNSTPHSTQPQSAEISRKELRTMALAALTAS